MKLLEHFKELSLHPKNAEELKGLILQLAVQGKLTANWREDNPNISIDINKLSECLKINPSQLTDHSKKIGDLKVPETWSKAKFSLVFDMKGGSQPPKSKFIDQPQNGYVQLFQIRDFGNKPNPVYVPINSVSKFCGSDDVMIGRYGASIGKIFYGKEGAYNVALVKLIWDRDILLQDFVYHIFSSRYIQEFFESCSRSAQAGFNKTDIGKLNICIPPLEEQKAIVEVVNTLFSEVEQLESLTKERIQLKESFVVSALNRLTEAEKTQEKWNFLQQHFSSFFTEKKNIKSLRETILQLAVQGKLTAKWRANNPNTEPASELLKRIEAEKQQLIAEKKIKKEKPLPPIGEDEMPYELPEGWVWCKLGQVCLRLIDGNYGESYPKKHEFINDGIPFFTAAAVGQNYDIKDAKVKFISSDKHSVLTKAQTTVGDVLLTNRGARVGDVAIITDERYTISNIGPQVTRIAVSHSNIYKRYIMYCIASPLFQRTIIELNSGSAMNFMNLTKTANMLIALPSKKEQYEIVEGINSLMDLCDELEQQIETSQTQIEQLMQSCLKEVFEQA